MVTDGLKNCGKHDLAKRIEQLEVSLRVELIRCLFRNMMHTHQSILSWFWGPCRNEEQMTKTVGENPDYYLSRTHNILSQELDQH
uniref:Uncharacterized protein n=1 Tax=Salix viminalis TaxID=40686 RepID=A0A6N2MNR1_SALVM